MHTISTTYPVMQHYGIYVVCSGTIIVRLLAEPLRTNYHFPKHLRPHSAVQSSICLPVPHEKQCSNLLSLAQADDFWSELPSNI